MLHKRYKQIVLTITLGLIGCNSTPTPTGQETTSQPAGDRPSVIATTSVLCDMTQQVAAETIDLTCLVAAGEDPHLYQPTPEDRKAIDQADLILYGGYDFEPALIKLIEATSNPAPKVAVHEVAVSQPIMAEPHSHDRDRDRDHSHASEETAPDPHVWHNAQNGIRMAETIRDNLEQVAPSHASLYNSNAQQITSKLAQVDAWIKSQIATIPPQNRKLVTTHDAMNYFAQAYGIPIEGTLRGISTEEAPTAARVSELVKDIRQSSVPTIFAEATINPRLIQTVAREANVQVSERKLFADGLGEPGTDADTYQNKLIANTRTIVEGLGGNYTPPQVASLN
ncbi:zinc ABC transporter substrate-binding protein [Gloeocapsa sp. BRSZ]